MARVQPLRAPKRRRKLLLLAETTLHLQGANGILSLNINTSTNGHAGSSGSGAKQIVRAIDQRGIQPDSTTYASLLEGCGQRKALAEGKCIHSHMIEAGFRAETFLGTKLVIMYAKCGSLLDAGRILAEMPERNVVSWTAMISACARNDNNEQALKLYYQMQREGIRPNRFTFAGVLAACANLGALKHGRRIHEDVTRSGSELDVFVGSALVNMYAKCGSTDDARHVFDEMPERNAVSWTAMIVGYAQNGRVDEALELFWRMPERDLVSWNAMIAGYAQNGQVEEALKVFEKMPERNSVSWNGMVAGFAQNMHVGQACKLFQKMPERNAVSWTALIVGYAQIGRVDEALKVFQKMPDRDSVSWNALIAGYAQNGQVDRALKLFQEMPQQDTVSLNVLIAAYAQNGLVEDALKLFQKMPEQDILSWNAMIAGYAQNGRFDEALKIFQQMQVIGVKPDSVTFSVLLPLCANLAGLVSGMELHETIIRNGFQSHMSVGSALVDMYAKSGNIDYACKVFNDMPARNVVSWTAIIAGYAQNGQIHEAWELFQKMPERDVVSWTTMIVGYTQNGQVDGALQLFQKMPEQDVVSWNAMVAGYAQNGSFNEALKLFKEMHLTGVKSDLVTFTSVLPACANLATLVSGRGVHGNIIRSGFQSHISVSSALVDMYAKCGTIEDACQLFDEISERDTVSWNSMIVGYAKHGHGREALQLFRQMQNSGKKPNGVTFIGVLSACSHAGLVTDGWKYFDCMSRDYHITPAVEHFNCMVDLLGRAGHLDEAQDFISKMPIKPNAAVWGSLLCACRMHADIALGERVAECLFELDPKHVGCYVLMSNIYAAAGKWDDVEKVRKLMKDRRVKKIPGCSWIEVNNEVYSFLVRDRLHPQTYEIYAELERLSQQMKEAGYVPDTNFVLHDV